MFRLCTLLMIFSVGISACASPDFIARPGDTVLADVTVIVGDGSAAQPQRSLVLREGRIAWTGAAQKLALEQGVETLSLEGKYVMPGLIDMHAHLTLGPVTLEIENGSPVVVSNYDEEIARSLAAALLENGVTTVRNPAGPTSESVAFREALESGAIRGPRMFTAGHGLEVVASPGLMTAVRTEQEVRDEVARQAAAGVDMIKLYQGLPPNLVKAGIDAAHAHGLPALGHLMATDWTTAAELGIDGIVHMLPASPALLPAHQRNAYVRGITGTQMMYQWFMYADLDAPEITRMIDTLAANGVAFDPTLVVVESIFHGDDPRQTDAAAFKDVPEALRASWQGFSLTTGWQPTDFAQARDQFPKALELTRRMHEAGVPLIAGSDLGNPWIAPDSLHRELELLNLAGIPPAEVIRIATLNGATALGIGSDTGSIVTGKRADIVVLAANPLESITNTRSIVHVFANGKHVFNRGQ